MLGLDIEVSQLPGHTGLYWEIAWVFETNSDHSGN